MGCTRDYVNINLKTKEMAETALKLFAELLKEDLYGDFFDINYINIEEKENGFWFYIDEEPLFKTWDAGEQIKYFVEEFVKKFPDEPFYLDDTESFNNCGDTTYYEYKYDEKLKELTIRTVYSEWGEGLYDCPECEECFEEALVYLENYEEGKTYICPECGAEIMFDAKETIEKIKLEDL